MTCQYATRNRQTIMIDFSRHFRPLLNVAALPAGLFLLGLPTLPAAAELNPARWNQFDVCVTELTNNGIPPEKAGTACSDALIPKQLSSCVAQIKADTPIDPEKALTACYQVRRPIDLANCVSDIQRATLNSVSKKENEAAEGEPSLPEQALDSCRASLLPGRHSECVIALSRDVKGISPREAMNTCLSAEDFPPDLFPAYTE
jgi:hypothetical protein